LGGGGKKEDARKKKGQKKVESVKASHDVFAKRGVSSPFASRPSKGHTCSINLYETRVQDCINRTLGNSKRNEVKGPGSKRRSYSGGMQPVAKKWRDTAEGGWILCCCGGGGGGGGVGVFGVCGFGEGGGGVGVVVSLPG